MYVQYRAAVFLVHVRQLVSDTLVAVYASSARGKTRLVFLAATTTLLNKIHGLEIMTVSAFP